MQDGKSNTNYLINTFTQGLRDLPMDVVTRVKNFLLEYLGHPQQPVPFGGRTKDVASLDRWLEDPRAEPYLLLAAPAGRGKSALLLRWCQQLFARQQLAIAYFPVSIRFRTNLAGVTFPALVALLASLHGEHIPADPNISEEVWRSLLAAYLMRPLPAGRRLLLVLDGVDEAADWSAGAQLFPSNPPPGLRIVVSARSLANDQDTRAWLARLGWGEQGLARTLELMPLDRPGIANVLAQMGFPLDLLSERIDMISELYRLSEGDPLLVRLYVDDLWKRGEQTSQFTTTDLHSIQPGLSGYFELWWKDQRQLWQDEAPQREATMQTMLNLLASALGPLSKRDLVSLTAQQENFREAEIEPHLAPLARFVTGDGVHQGYVFSHPRLGSYFYEERLNTAERQAIEQRFLNWGEQTLAALNTETLAPQAASPYIIQYYGAHLDRAQASTETLLSLVSNGWRRAWETLDRAQSGFLSDVERARQAAELEDKEAASSSEPLPYLGDEIRGLLCQVSVNSMTNSISPRLMLEAVKTGVWTPAQGLACIRLLHDLAARALELVGLASYVQEPLRTDILHEALDTAMEIKDDYLRFDALLALAYGLPEDLLLQILDVIQGFEDEADRAGMLAEIAPFCAAYPRLLVHLLEMAEAIEEQEYRGLAYEGLAAYLPASLQARLLADIQALQEERYRIQALLAFIPHLPEEALQTISQHASSIEDGLSQMRLLTELVIYLPDRLKTEYLQETLSLEKNIEDLDYRIEMLLKLAPFLSTDKLQYALDEINYHWDERVRANALAALMPHMPDDLLSPFLQAVLKLKSEEARTNVLLPLLPRLSTEALAAVLDAATITWDEGYRATLLAQFGPIIPESLLPQLLEVIWTIKDPGYRVWLLAELEEPLQDKLVTSQFNMSASFQVMPNLEKRLQTLLAIAPRLSDTALARLFEFMLAEIFNIAWQSRSEEEQTHILTKLGGRLPLERIATALETVQAFFNEANQAQVLLALAPQLHDELLSSALAIIRNMQEPEKRAQVLEALVATLPEAQQATRIQEILQVLQLIKDAAPRIQFIQACTPFLHEKLSPELAHIMLDASLTMHEEKNQALILRTFVPYISSTNDQKVLDIVVGMQNEGAQTLILEKMAPYVSQEHFVAFLNATHKLQNPRWRTQILVNRSKVSSQTEIARLLEIALATQDIEWRINLLEMLIPRIPTASLTRAWEAVLALSNQGRQTQLFRLLIPRMQDDFFPSLWSAILTNAEENPSTLLLRTIAPHLSATLFVRIWERAQILDNSEIRTEILTILAPYVPESYFKPVWDMLPELFHAYSYWSMLARLADRVPEAELYAFFTAIETIPQENMLLNILERLLPHALDILLPYLSEDFFASIQRYLYKLSSKSLQTRLLLTLIPHLSQSMLDNVWTELRQIKSTVEWMQVIKAFLPYATEEQLKEIQYDAMRLDSAEQQLEIIEVLVSYLTVEECMAMLQIVVNSQSIQQYVEGFIGDRWEKQLRLRSITVLTTHLSDEQRGVVTAEILDLLDRLSNEDEQGWNLTYLAPNLPEDLYDQMLQAIWSLHSTQQQDQVLAALQADLSPAGWLRLLELVVRHMHETDDPHVVIQLLKQAPAWVEQSNASILYPILGEILHLLARTARREALIELTTLIPAIHHLGGDKTVLNVAGSVLEVGLWWP
ncbi:hypothetical protein KDA_57330 [Dictyobacter alpinus]|uniref:NACHT domain-containing protein n=1 Tax=Dictyobacter alpinus TaxID=2014873 RepID=A0A402BG09_9CHLR|nr:ATP-binding protein [Dictyobacter alpinus]GCE30249.1 hypothetical protein KDA_57330 [Dictyobacter alpinus]